MKKLLVTLLTLALLLLPMQVLAAEDAPVVTVTIVDGTGAIVLAAEPVTVTDADGDGALTVGDALCCAHEAAGRPEDFASLMHEEYGLSLIKLWGDDSGNFGYYLNHNSCWSLADAVADGDYVAAFVYTDTNFFSDTYCFFDKTAAEGETGAEIALTLTQAGWDEDWNPVQVPAAGAVITIDGQDAANTDENGAATLVFNAPGDYLISARSDSGVLVPPVCLAHITGEAMEEPTEEPAEEPTEEPVNEPTEEPAENTPVPENTEAPEEYDSPKTGDAPLTALWIGLAVTAAGLLFVVLRRKHEA